MPHAVGARTVPLPVTGGLIGWYDMSSANSTVWADKSGTGNHATITNCPIVSTSGGGAATLNFALQGSNSSACNIVWPAANVLPSTYTLFHVSRYLQTGGNNGRIYVSSTAANNWLSGFWNNCNPVAYHSGWLTQSTYNVFSNNWVIVTDQNSLIRAQGRQYGWTGQGASPYAPLSINGFGSEWSAFQTAECVVYNRTLSQFEVGQVETYLSEKYGIPLVSTTGSTSNLPSTNCLFYADGTSLTGWTVTSATINGSDGSANAPCLQATGTQYAYTTTPSVSSFLNKTIFLNMKVIAGSVCLANFYYGCNSTGGGWMLRLEARGGTNYSGITNTTSWSSWTAPAAGNNVTAGAWNTIKIQIDGNANTIWYLNGALQENKNTPLNGAYFAIHGDGATVTGGLYDDIYIYDGVI